jgi:hypothetical protein
MDAVSEVVDYKGLVALEWRQVEVAYFEHNLVAGELSVTVVYDLVVGRESVASGMVGTNLYVLSQALEKSFDIVAIVGLDTELDFAIVGIAQAAAAVDIAQAVVAVGNA